MPISSGFSDFFKQYLPWHKAETDYLAGILTAMLLRPTLNLVRYKDTLPSQAKPASFCRCEQRFLPINDWRICASIELSFGRLKSKAFNLEDAHMAAPVKMTVLTIGAVNTRAAAKSHRLAARNLCRHRLDALRLFFGSSNPAYFSDRHQNRYH